MGMQVDESGGNHQSAGIDHALSGQGAGRHARDPVPAYANVAHVVQAGLRVNYPTVIYRQVIVSRNR